MFMIREILGYCIISAVCLLGMAVLYAPVCFLLRNRVPPAKQIAYFMFGACVIIVLAATVIVGASKTAAADRSLNLVPFQVFQETWGMPEPKKIAQTAANVVMFVPLGVMMPVAFRRMRSFGKTALSLALFSFVIEFTQYFTGRSADIDDLMLNTLGGILGYLIFFVASKLFWKKRPRRTNRAYHRSVRKS
ncbi:MAG: VanZ family protein [Oscillibacter sp.]|uniref:VanZ family protein n=1 Tax=Oscillibacter sp. TaxID=1945593 RepID=UPI0021733773|nr:VanZ family protein [Oscillibacter sp.]MCI9112628.1 VanZ family protein [Oscillibacter sp.]